MDGIVDVQAWCDHPLAWGGWGFAGLVVIVVGAVTWFVVLAVRERRSGAHGMNASSFSLQTVFIRWRLACGSCCEGRERSEKA